MKRYSEMYGDAGYEEVYMRHQRYREDVFRFLDTCDWEWFGTFNLDRYDVPGANKTVQKFLSRMCINEGIQVGAKGVINSMPHPHIHLLMIGNSKRGRRLMNVDERVWERNWYEWLDREAVIKAVTDVQGAVGYVSDCNTPMNLFELVNPYNMKLLEKMAAIKQNPALDVRKGHQDPYPRRWGQSWGHFDD